MRILVADDDRATRLMLRSQLERLGYEVVPVSDGKEALDVLTRDEAISMLITDWMMPNMDGLQVAREVRRMARQRYLPVLLLTSRGEKQALVDGLNAGADAFLTKPLSPPELEAQIKVALRIIDLEEKLKEQLAEIQHAHDYLRRDLEAASRIQRSLLPSEIPVIEGVEFSWIYQACEMVGGDMFNIFAMDDGRIGIYVLDVLGHGVPAALLSVTLNHVLSPFTLHGGLLAVEEGSGRRRLLSPADVATELNRRFPVMSQSGLFFTLLYGILDLEEQSFRYVRAGHPGPVHLANGIATMYDEEGGMPVGIATDAAYPESVLKLSRGDRVILYTDGIGDAHNSDGKDFSTHRLRDVLQERHEQPIGEIINSLCREAELFSNGRMQEDDITIVGFELK